MTNVAKVFIDNKAYEVSDGQNLLHTALSLGLNLPYFCWHPAMGSVGACRLCAVKQFKDEEDTQGKLVMACMTPAQDGARFSITSPEAREFRRSVLE
jgi:NADH-quinone oxidoreductase subunit G